MIVTTSREQPRSLGFVVAILAGAALSVLLGVYGEVHDPTGQNTFDAFFSSMIAFKVWCTCLVLAFGLVQVLTSLRLYGRLRIPAREPGWLGDAHRLSGTLALLVSLPVAYHCLWSLGFNGGASDTRVLLHSLAGCALYGAYLTKVSFVRLDRLPGAALPITGGLVFSLLVLLWVTSSLWFLRTFPTSEWF